MISAYNKLASAVSNIQRLDTVLQLKEYRSTRFLTQTMTNYRRDSILVDNQPHLSLNDKPPYIVVPDKGNKIDLFSFSGITKTAVQ